MHCRGLWGASELMHVKAICTSFTNVRWLCYQAPKLGGGAEESMWRWEIKYKKTVGSF